VVDEIGATQDNAFKNESGQTLDVVNAANPPTVIYTNNIIVKMSRWDFLLDLGQIVDATKERLAIETQARIAMSPQHAKAFARLMNERVKLYEELYGRIPTRQLGKEVDEDDAENDS